MGFSLVGTGTTTGQTLTSSDFSALSGLGPLNGATEAPMQMLAPTAGAFSALTTAQGPVTGTFTGKFRKNAANGNQVVTDSAQTDSTHTDSVAAGDKVDVAWTGVTAATAERTQCLFKATSGHWAMYGNSGAAAGQSYSAGATVFPRLLSGGLGGGASEANAQFRVGAAGTLSGLYIYVISNAATGSTTVTLRKGGVDATQTFTIAAGATGLFQDGTHNDSIAVGDLICAKIVVGAGGALVVGIIGVGFQSNDLTNDIGSVGNTSLSAAKSYCLYGQNAAGFASDALAQIVPGFRATITCVAVNVSANTTTGASSVATRVNAGAGAISVNIPAGQTGWFFDNAHADGLSATDAANLLVTPGGGGNITLQMVVVTMGSFAAITLQATTSPTASLLRGRVLQASTSPVASLKRSAQLTRRALANTASSLQRQTNKQLGGAWLGSYIQLTDVNAGYNNLEGSAADDPYVYFIPHNSNFIVKVDTRKWGQGAAAAVVGAVDISSFVTGTPTGTGAFSTCCILGGHLYCFPHGSGATNTQTVLRVDLSNFAAGGVETIDLTACGFPIFTTTTWAGGVGDGARYVYLGMTDNKGGSCHSGIVRIDSTNFTTGGVGFINTDSLYASPRGFIEPYFDPLTSRVYFCTIWRPDGVNVIGAFAYLDTTNFTLGGVTIQALQPLPYTPVDEAYGSGIFFVDASYIWAFPSSTTANEMARIDKTTLAVVDRFDTSRYGGQFIWGNNHPFYDGSRWAYEMLQAVVPYGANKIVVVDTQNPGAPFDVIDVSFFEPDVAAVQSNAAMLNGYIYWSPVGGAEGRPIRIKARAATDSFVNANGPATLTRRISKSLSAIANALATALTPATYLGSASDSLSSADAPSATLAVAGSSSESVSAADAITSLGTFGVSSSETGAAVDTPSSTAVLFSTATEASAGVDLPDATTTMTVSDTEALAAADAENARLDFATQATEAGSAVDTASTTAVLPSGQLEAGAASETIMTTAVQGVSQADAGAAVDTPSSIATLPSSVAEAGGASEAASGALVAPASTAEAGSASDAPVAALGSADSALEAAAAADVPSMTLGASGPVSEAAGATDVASSSIDLVDAASDSLSASDAVACVVLWAGAVSESGAASDAENAVAIFASAVAELLAAADAPSTTAVLQSTVAESGAAVDQASGPAVIPVTASDAGAASDATSSSAALASAVSESGSAAEVAAAGLVSADSVAETGTASDLAAALMVVVDSAHEAGSAGETVTMVLVVATAASEAGNAQDLPASLVVASGTIVETGAAADLAAGVSSIPVALADALAAADLTDSHLLATYLVSEVLGAQDLQTSIATLPSSAVEALAALDVVYADLLRLVGGNRAALVILRTLGR